MSASAEGHLDGAQRRLVECSADFPLVPPGVAAVSPGCTTPDLSLNLF